MAATLTARFFRKPSSPGVIVIRRDTDGYRYDFSDSTFKASPTTDYSAPTEDSSLPGMYLFQIADQEWDGLYQLFWYPTSAKAHKPLVLAINLTDGAQDNAYTQLAQTVRLDLDANSAMLASIEADTQDLQTQIGTAGAGLTGLPTVDANIVQVNSITIDGVGTVGDPWGPAA